MSGFTLASKHARARVPLRRYGGVWRSTAWANLAEQTVELTEPRPAPPRFNHKIHLVNDRGGVSPLCATTPRAMTRRMGAVKYDVDVTCPRCLTALKRPTRPRPPRGSHWRVVTR